MDRGEHSHRALLAAAVAGIIVGVHAPAITTWARRILDIVFPSMGWRGEQDEREKREERAASKYLEEVAVMDRGGRRDDYEIDLKPNTWNPAFGKTMAMYLEDRAIQLYDYAIVRKKERNRPG